MADMVPKRQYDQILLKIQQLYQRNDQLEALNRSLMFYKQVGTLKLIDKPMQTVYTAQIAVPPVQNPEQGDSAYNNTLLQGLVKYEFYSNRYFKETLAANAKALRNTTEKLLAAKQTVLLTNTAFSTFFTDFGAIMHDFMVQARVEKTDKAVYWNGAGEIKVTYEDGSGRNMQYISKESKPADKYATKQPASQVLSKHTLSPYFCYSDYSVEKLISYFQAYYGSE